MEEKNQQRRSGPHKEFLEGGEEKPIIKDFKKTPFEKYQHAFRSSFTTLFLGILLGMFGFVILGYSEGITREADVVRSLPLINSANVLKNTGMIKVIGIPNPACDITVPACTDNLLYSKTIREELHDNEWVVVRTDESMANFTLSSIAIDSGKAEFIFDLEEKFRDEGSDYREITYGVTDKERIIVIGELNYGSIEGGDIFVISNKTSQNLLQLFKDESNFDWWHFKLIAFILLTIGFTAFVLPILSFLDIFTNFGWIATSIIFLFSAILSFILVSLTTLIMSFWWLIFILAGLVIIMLIRIKRGKIKDSLTFIP